MISGPADDANTEKEIHSYRRCCICQNEYSMKKCSGSIYARAVRKAFVSLFFPTPAMTTRCERAKKKNGMKQPIILSFEKQQLYLLRSSLAFFLGGRKWLVWR